MTPPDISKRLTVRPNEAAALLGVSRRSIERAIRDGRLRSTRTIGGRLIVAADVLSLAGVGVTPAITGGQIEPAQYVRASESP
jgi:excisionase family DNA binding protein